MNMVSKKYIPDKGDLVYMNFDPTFGHEQKGRRPALVLSKSVYNNASGLCLIVPITSKIKGYSFEVLLSDHLMTKGVVLSDQIKSFAWEERHVEFIEKVNKILLDEVYSKAITFFQ